MASNPIRVTINGCDYGVLRVVPWTGAIGDYNAGWQAFVRAVFGFLADVCYTHCGPVGANNGTHAKHLANKAFRKGRFLDLLYAISRLTNEHVAKIARSRLVDVIS